MQRGQDKLTGAAVWSGISDVEGTQLRTGFEDYIAYLCFTLCAPYLHTTVGHQARAGESGDTCQQPNRTISMLQSRPLLPDPQPTCLLLTASLLPCTMLSSAGCSYKRLLPSATLACTRLHLPTGKTWLACCACQSVGLSPAAQCMGCLWVRCMHS